MDLGGFLELSPILLTNEILHETYSEKNFFLENKEKENYNNVEVPYIIIGAISGEIDIFNLIINNGALNFNTSGHITLGKKQKNSVISNCLGACAYYGRKDLLNFILQKKYSGKIILII
jgi:hypothetical protein